MALDISAKRIVDEALDRYRIVAPQCGLQFMQEDQRSIVISTLVRRNCTPLTSDKLTSSKQD